ncbi:hypothetical protein [Pontibacter liquoris]|uniref:hypothetical protein n=1 Tax=Pontibacter liquoris TaxID=2905677 RepID=UPI001FA7422B|nr:hypothetical protein [Pontibacter liquoris]
MKNIRFLPAGCLALTHDLLKAYTPVRRLLRTTAFAAVVLLGSAMTDAGDQESRYIKQADKAFALEDYTQAALLYAKAVELAPRNVQATYKLGMTYVELHQPKQAKLYFAKALKLDAAAAKDFLLYLADASQQDYDFAQARLYYQQEIKQTPPADADYLAFLRKRLDECAAGETLTILPPLARVVNAGPVINSEYADYVPVLMPGDSAMFYTTRRPGNRLADAAGVEQIRVSRLLQGQWQPTTLFLKPQDKMAQHAVVSVSASGQELYTFFAGKGLHVSRRQPQGSWSAPEQLETPFNKGAKEPSLYITADGKFAIFSSDRTGGFGGLDIYMCYKQTDGRWSDALNLGPTINTPYDEDAPFVDMQTNTLYFSSRGHNSMGGFDIFRSSISNAEWSQAQNLGLPVNSPQDDIYFTLSTDRTTAFFSSDRPGGFGAKDIYQLFFQ